MVRWIRARAPRTGEAASRRDVITPSDGVEVERRKLPTAPAHNYILWADAGPNDVWLATGKGLTHGIARAPEKRGAVDPHERKK